MQKKHPMLALCMLAIAVCSAHSQEDSTAAMRIDSAMAIKRDHARPRERRVYRSIQRPDSTMRRTQSKNEMQARAERATALGNRMKSIGQIDSLQGVSEEDKALLKKRYQILHPID